MSMNDVRDFEEEEATSRVDVALRRLIDRVEADQAFMTELADWDGWGVDTTTTALLQ